MKETLAKAYAQYEYNEPAKAVVLLSGGQDSTTVLALAIRMHRAQNVTAISFDYNQRHRSELEAAQRIAQSFRITHHTAKTGAMLDLAPSALTGAGQVNANHPLLPGRPASFVPNRNALFLTTAHALALAVGAEFVYIGANQTDFSGYPDCRTRFLNQLFIALNSGSEANVAWRAPLLDMTKAETFALAQDLGVLQLIVGDTVTCYEGKHATALPGGGGMGCGNCPACELRMKGWAEFNSAMEAK